MTIACEDIIIQLQQCHESSFARYFGQCNSIKRELSACFRDERFARQKQNQSFGRERKAKVEARWKEVEVVDDEPAS